MISYNIIIPSHPLSIKQWAFTPPNSQNTEIGWLSLHFHNGPGSFLNPCSVVVNWFFQFVKHCRCYLHLLFSIFITDEVNIVHFVLKLILQVHLFVFIWNFIQIFFLFWRNFPFFRCIICCVFFKVSVRFLHFH